MLTRNENQPSRNLAACHAILSAREVDDGDGHPHHARIMMPSSAEVFWWRAVTCSSIVRSASTALVPEQPGRRCHWRTIVGFAKQVYQATRPAAACRRTGAIERCGRHIHRSRSSSARQDGVPVHVSAVSPCTRGGSIPDVLRLVRGEDNDRCSVELRCHTPPLQNHGSAGTRREAVAIVKWPEH